MAVTTLILENNPNRDVRHAALLNALREHFNNPDIDIEYTGKGKPIVKNINKHISVTTVEDMMICAISDTVIGIDGEHVTRFADSKTDFVAIAERFFTDEEADYVREGDDVALRFAKIWVRKEAYCKFTGKGLSDFANFSVTDGERFYSKINGIPIKRFNVSIPSSSEYFFAIVGDYSA